MDQINKPNYAKGIFLTKRKSKDGKEFFQLAIKNGEKYDQYLCFLSDKKDKYGNDQYTIYVKSENPPF